MEKLKKVALSVLAAVIVLAVSVILVIKSYTHTLSNFVADTNSISVYIPDGQADDYIDAMGLSIREDHRIWEYELDEKETEAIITDLDNGIWTKLNEKEYAYIDRMFFNGEYLSLEMSDSLYYCLFDCNADAFVAIDTDNGAVVGIDRVLFVYDDAERTYCCVRQFA